jgi:hypothetical protein
MKSAGPKEATSRVRAPLGINYLQVELKSGERWRYEPPAGHTVAWVSVYEGELHTPAIVPLETLAVFEESNAAIEFVANGGTSFVLGSAIKHPHKCSSRQLPCKDLAMFSSLARMRPSRSFAKVSGSRSPDRMARTIFSPVSPTGKS